MPPMLGIEVRPGDYDQPDALRTSLAGVDALVLVSGMAPPEDRIGQHRNVIEAANAAGVRKIVYTSIQGPEVGTAFSPRRAEQPPDRGRHPRQRSGLGHRSQRHLHRA